MAALTYPNRRALPIGPLLLISLGILLLLNNLGVVPWTVWQSVLQFWPVGLILIGIQALVTGRVDWLSLVLVLLAVAVLSLFTGFSRMGPPRGQPASGTLTSSFQQDLQGARVARVRLEFGGGELNLHDLPAGANLAEATLSGDGATGLTRSYSVHDGQGTLEIGSRPGPGERGPWFRRGDRSAGRLDLGLAQGVPLDLEIRTGASAATLDLRDLSVSRLLYETGASHSSVVLPATGVTQAEIQGGAASLDIEVPEGVAARIRTSGSGLSQVEVDESRFPQTGDGFESPEYASATNRVDLTVQVGVASVNIH